MSAPKAVCYCAVKHPDYAPCKPAASGPAFHVGFEKARCHAQFDGDCEWTGCPQKTNYRTICPLAKDDR